jgi:hypothetical protein
MNTNALSVLDVEKAELVNTVLLDDMDQGAANPWGVACSADGKWLCVTHAGTHELSVVDRGALHAKLDKASDSRPKDVRTLGRDPSDVPNNLAFLVGLRRRLRLAGNGPRAVAVIGDKAYVAEYFADSIGVVGLDPEARHKPRSIPLRPAGGETVVRRGERYFNDATRCFQGWQSCASCHPDARADGLNWDLLNDGIGNPKNTKSLLLSHRTPPAMATGVRAKAEVAVRAGMKFIEFRVMPEEDAVAIDEYLKSLKPLSSPLLVDGKLSPTAEKGREVFGEAGCADCHPAPLFTDLRLYDVGTTGVLDAGRKLDTPTILENWRTAPYLHDGRAASMREVLTTHNKGDTHGATSKLSEEEINALVEFLLSQ